MITYHSYTTLKSLHGERHFVETDAAIGKAKLRFGKGLLLRKYLRDLHTVALYRIICNLSFLEPAVLTDDQKKVIRAVNVELDVRDGLILLDLHTGKWRRIKQPV